jgi:hypothetical protein
MKRTLPPASSRRTRSTTSTTGPARTQPGRGEHDDEGLVGVVRVGDRVAKPGYYEEGEAEASGRVVRRAADERDVLAVLGRQFLAVNYGAPPSDIPRPTPETTLRYEASSATSTTR